MTCEQIRHALGVYVLGSIDPTERTEVDTHLASCPVCRDELAGLAGLPALLAKVPAETVGDGSAPPDQAPDPGVLTRLVERVTARRKRVRRLFALAACVVVILFAGGVTGAYLASGDGGSESTTSGVTVTATNEASGVSGRVTMHERAWGTEVTVRLSGVPRYATCRLVAVGEEGTRSVAGSWHVSYDGGVDVEGATALRPGTIAEFEVVTREGRRLLTIPAPNGGGQ